jgi:hypothetical protein
VSKPGKTNELLKRICRESLGSVLPDLGFVELDRRSHSLISAEYRRVSGNIVQIVDVQRDKYWSNDAGKFCINFWIRIPTDEGTSKTNAIEGKESSDWFGLHERLGRLATGEDYWWTIERKLLSSESKTVQRIVGDLTTKWDEFGTSWFARFPDLCSARDYCATGWSRTQAMRMSIALGELSEARELFIDHLGLGKRPSEEELQYALSSKVISSDEFDVLRRLVLQHVDVITTGLEKLFGRSRPRSPPVDQY